jgi:hypothetical protein
MPELLLGPLLRYIGQSEATVWIEADAPCEVEVLGTTAETFCVDGHHFALVTVKGLEPGSAHEYEVRLDGVVAWPEQGTNFPPSVIRMLGAGPGLRLAFGSCRIALPQEPPFALQRSRSKHAHGVDALRALGLRVAAAPARERPDMLLTLGDQIYADELSPAMREVTEARGSPEGAPRAELATFEEYSLAYREAWSEPAVRWLLSTVPTAMVCDDHEIQAQWKTSHAWLQSMRSRPWYDDRIRDGLTAYWVYQHLGNESPAELEENELLARVTAAEDAGSLLRELMHTVDRRPGHGRWSYRRDLGANRLVVLDSRAARSVSPGRREIMDDEEWSWFVGQVAGDVQHLLLASSVPFFLPPGTHHGQACNEAVCDGAWGRVAARVGEALRRRMVLDHWASFQRSFRRMAALLEEIAAGSRGGRPASIVMLSGDVHHCYLAEVGFRGGAKATAPVWQAVCSGFRKELAASERLVMRLGSARPLASLTSRLARAAGVPAPGIGWRLVERPRFGNQLGTVELSREGATVRVETTAGSDWRSPALRTVFQRELASGSPTTRASPRSARTPRGRRRVAWWSGCFRARPRRASPRRCSRRRAPR